MTTEELRGQRVVVFGASSGAGLASAGIAQALGAEVMVVGRDAAKLKEAAAQFEGRISVFAVDGRDPAAVDDFFSKAGEIDHLIIPAGATSPGGEFATAMTRQAFRETFEGKFWVQVNVAYAGARKLRKGGSIILFSGAAAHRALRGMANVAAVNGALEAIVPTLALELAPTRVNAISPGTLDTPYWTGVPDARKAEIFQRQAELLPAGRVGTADDIARAVRFLLTTSFATGTVVRVDGGLPLSRA